jgi:hypothetical protein
MISVSAFGQTSGCLAQIQNGRVSDIRSLLDAAIELADAGFTSITTEDLLTEARFFEAKQQLQQLRALGDTASTGSAAQPIWSGIAESLCTLVSELKKFALSLPGVSSRMGAALQILDRELAKSPTPPFVEEALPDIVTEFAPTPAPTPTAPPARVPPSRAGLIIGLVGAGLAVVGLGVYLVRRGR